MFKETRLFESGTLAIRFVEHPNEGWSVKDERIQELESDLASAERELKGALDGWRREVVLSKEQTLPVPRLELVLTDVDEYSRQWSYRLVRRFFTGEILATPIGHTTTTGGPHGSPLFTAGPNAGKLPLPHRDGAHICHDMAHLGLPGFAIYGDHVDDLSALAGKPHDRW